MFLLKFILTNICGHFECFFGKNYLYCAWLGISVSLDERPIGIVCRITGGGKVRVITVYEDKPKGE